jgi:hypothetical protein
MPFAPSAGRLAVLVVAGPSRSSGSPARSRFGSLSCPGSRAAVRSLAGLAADAGSSWPVVPVVVSAVSPASAEREASPLSVLGGGWLGAATRPQGEGDQGDQEDPSQSSLPGEGNHQPDHPSGMERRPREIRAGDPQSRERIRAGCLRRGAYALSFSRYCLRNLATFGAMTTWQYGWNPLFESNSGGSPRPCSRRRTG